MKTTIIIAFIVACMMVLFIGFSCRKESSLEKFIAKGTLKDNLGNCMTAVVHGNFYNGVELTDANYIEVKVNVQKTGNYYIYTNMQNGFSFVDSGIFQAAGLSVIELRPVGIPLNPIQTNFSLSFDTSTCFFSINVHDSAELNINNTFPVNAWQFTDAKTGITHRGTLDTNYIYTLGLQKMLVLSTKKATEESDSTLLINIIMPNGVLEKGTYSTDDAPNGMVFKTFDEACLNCAGGGLIPISTGATVIFIINSYNPSTKIVKGTFSGTTLDQNEEIAPISNGQFAAVVQ